MQRGPLLVVMGSPTDWTLLCSANTGRNDEVEAKLAGLDLFLVMVGAVTGCSG